MAAITSVGFNPAGHVLSAAVVHLGYVSRGGKCSVTGSNATRTNLASAESGPFNLLLTLHIGERECPAQEGTHDHVAEATILGTAIAAFARSPHADNQPPLTIMHLNLPAVTNTGIGREIAQPPPNRPDSEGGIADRLALAWAARNAARSRISFSDSAGITKKSD